MEQGVEIVITRWGVPVVRLVPEPMHGLGEGVAGRRERVEAALGRLRQLGEGIALEGSLKAEARKGLDGGPGSPAPLLCSTTRCFAAGSWPLRPRPTPTQGPASC
ncbi:MAG: hypothetical protein RLZZ609_1000 [Cyanobacteriota bacterium]